MPPRSITAAILVFWLIMTGWLIQRDLWPLLAPGEPPRMLTLEGDAERAEAPRITLERTRCLGGHRHFAALACRALLNTDPLGAAREVSDRVSAAEVAPGLLRALRDGQPIDDNRFPGWCRFLACHGL